MQCSRAFCPCAQHTQAARCGQDLHGQEPCAKGWGPAGCRTLVPSAWVYWVGCLGFNFSWAESVLAGPDHCVTQIKELWAETVRGVTSKVNLVCLKVSLGFLFFFNFLSGLWHFNLVPCCIPGCKPKYIQVIRRHIHCIRLMQSPLYIMPLV